MKALSIRQPWAWAILYAGKNIENRTWNTTHRGDFLIHAGSALDEEAFRLMQLYPIPNVKLPERDEFPRGGIVGQATLIDVMRPGSPMTVPWYEGEYGFVLTHARALPFRPLKGKLNFFEVDYDLLYPFAAGGQHEALAQV